jgi:hypothetical protein
MTRNIVFYREIITNGGFKMNANNSIVKDFFGVVIRRQTYLSMLYLLLAFPLGIIYFVFLVTGISLGLGTLITWVGFLILLIVMMTWWGFAMFEHKIASWMLPVEMNPMSKADEKDKNIWQKFKAHISNPVTWKSLVHLFVKFPLGILSFVVAVVFISVSLGLLSAPFVYKWAEIDFYIFTVETIWQALMVFVVGFIVGLISLHLMNGLAFLYGQFAKVMLGRPEKTTEIANEESNDLEE